MRKPMRLVLYVAAALATLRLLAWVFRWQFRRLDWWMRWRRRKRRWWVP